MKKRLSILITSISVLIITAMSGSIAFAQTAAQKAACEGAGLTASSGDCSGDSGTVTVDNVIRVAINILSAIVGLVAVIVIMVGGLKYVTSGGDSNKIGSAKTSITYAIIGLIIAAFAQVLVHFVLFRVTTDPSATRINQPTDNSGCAGSASGTDPGCQQPSPTVPTERTLPKRP